MNSTVTINAASVGKQDANYHFDLVGDDFAAGQDGAAPEAIYHEVPHGVYRVTLTIDGVQAGSADIVVSEDAETFTIPTV